MREETGAANEGPCTCHPSEAPIPCEQRYAYSDCASAAEVRQERGAQGVYEGIHAGIPQAAERERKVAVYRHFSKDGQLLYVGKSVNPFERLSGHIRRGDWPYEIAAVTLQWFDDETAALDAEHLAIMVENPIWNATTKRGGTGGRPLLGQEHKTLAATKPWEKTKPPMSRASWYRRQKDKAKRD